MTPQRTARETKSIILNQRLSYSNGKRRKHRPGGSVRIDGNRIRTVSTEPIGSDRGPAGRGDRRSRKVPDAGTDRRALAAFLAPNTTMDLMTADESYTQLKAGREAERTLLRGFTTIRDAGGPVFGLKRAIDEGIVAGPRIFPSGSMISQTGGHGDFRAVYDIPRPFECCDPTHTEMIGAATIADGPDAVAVAARNNLRLAPARSS